MGRIMAGKRLKLRQTQYGRKGTLRKKGGIIIMYGEKQLGIVTQTMSDMDALQCKPWDPNTLNKPIHDDFREVFLTAIIWIVTQRYL